jgi:uncharacterized protein (DUF58 family)
MHRFVNHLACALNHDFCPGANRYVYWLKQPIGWFVLAATAAAFIGFSVSPQALFVFAAILVVIVVGVAWPWVGLRGISVDLAFDRRRASEGSTVRVLITVVNRWPFPVWGLAVERGFFVSPNDEANERPAASLARIPAWSRMTFTWDFEPKRRGRYPIENPQIASGFPFGIWQGRRPIRLANELLVWPRMADLTSVPPVRGRAAAVTGTASRHIGQEGDMSGVRPFRPGDWLRHVHWAQTAKHDRLMVRERQATGRRSVELVIDVDREAHPDTVEFDSLEEVIRVGASIGRQFHAHHANVSVRFGGQTTVVSAGPVGLNRLLDSLALWMPGGPDSLPASAACAPSATSTALRERVFERQTDLHAHAKPWEWHPRSATTSKAANGAGQPALLVVVTTDAGAVRWKSELLRSRDAQLVVLRFGRSEPQLGRIVGCEQLQRPESARDACLTLDAEDEVLSRLVRGWERICQSGWSSS